MRFFRPFTIAILAAFLATIPPADAQEPKAAPAPIEITGIHNAFRVTDRIFSGSQPEGDAAFAELARLGVKTIITVDGSKPDVETARKHGLRYIHLPIGYDGISDERARQLTKAAATVEGPIFVHCHHGKHRGPAAVGIMCEASAGWSPAQTELWLQAAGTSTDYLGLYQAVREFRPISKTEINRLAPLPEITKTEPLVDTMVAIDERFDALKALQKNGWKPASENPTASPAATATLFWEQVRELARTDDTAKRPADYRTKLTDCEKAAEALRTGLNAPSLDVAAVEAAFKQIGQTCTSCHKAFRNEKK